MLSMIQAQESKFGETATWRVTIRWACTEVLHSWEVCPWLRLASIRSLLIITLPTNLIWGKIAYRLRKVKEFQGLRRLLWPGEVKKSLIHMRMSSQRSITISCVKLAHLLRHTNNTWRMSNKKKSAFANCLKFKSSSHPQPVKQQPWRKESKHCIRHRWSLPIHSIWEDSII